MADAVKCEIEEIKTLILTEKSLAYASLLVLQRSSAENASSMETLSFFSHSLLPDLLSDIYHREEEIAAQALKCLGFMLYHKSLVSSISEESARLVLDSLMRLVMTTKMKAICNLAVWCVSVQQLDPFTVECCIDTILRAVVYAIDNPFGSLSTTFEAVQATVKIATQVPERIRDAANIWLPPIYRKLISYDKKERDMAERCLMKTKPAICPASSTLSKVVARDLKNNLLARMMNMQHDIHMKMLKLPELTFIDAEPQVQIASLVAWEHLINAFLPSDLNTIQGVAIEEKIPGSSIVSERVDYELPKDLLRRIKVLMVPLQGIISSKGDISVCMSCINTWNYLLHKLDVLVNHPLVLQTTFRPFIEVVFSKMPDSENICLWKPCLGVFDQYISRIVKSNGMDLVPTASSCDVTDENECPVLYKSSRVLRMHYSIKWLPWKLGDLDFPLTVVKAIVSHGHVTPIDPEIRTFAFSSAMKIFKSVFQGFKAEAKRPSVSCDMIQLCLNAIMKSMKEICEGSSSRNDRNNLMICYDMLSSLF